MHIRLLNQRFLVLKNLHIKRIQTNVNILSDCILATPIAFVLLTSSTVYLIFLSFFLERRVGQTG